MLRFRKICGNQKLFSISSLLSYGLSLFIVSGLSVSLSTAFAQNSDDVDLAGLRAQLESNRKPLNSEKEKLDLEEKALMEKLSGKATADSQPPAATLNEDSFESFDTIQFEKPVQAQKTEIEPAAISKPEVKVEVKKEKPVKVYDSAEIALDEPKVKEARVVTADSGKKVADLQAKLAQKERELEETRNRLLIAETQVERLSGLLEKINKQKVASYLGNEKAPQAQAVSRSVNSNNVSQANSATSSDGTLIGTVTSQKAFLRSGPSKDDSPIMSVSKGTRLVVETRNSNWYRVITPTGGRAWIATEMLGFGPGNSGDSGSALKIGGYEKSAKSY